MQVPLHFIGVDVSKAELVIATHGQDDRLSVPNECTAIQQWLRTLAPGSLVAMESTGRYHQLLANLAAATALPVFVLNARDVYFYAKGLGARAARPTGLTLGSLPATWPSTMTGCTRTTPPVPHRPNWSSCWASAGRS